MADHQNGPAAIDLTPLQRAIVCDILRRLVPDRAVWVFGSRANGTAKTYSDLDLALIGPLPLGLARLAELREAFEESALPFKVDLIDGAALTPAFRQVIEDRHIVLSC